MTQIIQSVDTAPIKAIITSDGFLEDTPIIGRIGIQVYDRNGLTSRELRPPDEVFSDETLNSAHGKPMTAGHVFVDSENAEQTVVGSIISPAFADGNFIRSKLTVYSGRVVRAAKQKVATELSLGFAHENHSTPGWWNESTWEIIWKTPDTPELPSNLNPADWQEFDVVQRKIRINHLAVVWKARAGRDARFSLDGENMPLVKHKIGEVEYEIPEPVAGQINALNDALTQERSRKSTDQAMAEGLKAKIDQMQATIDGFDQRVELMKQTWQSDNKVRAELEVSAKQFGVSCDGLSNKEVKLEMLRRAGAGDMSDKTDAYIDAAFDLRKSMFSSDALAFGIGNSFSGGMQHNSNVDPLDAAYEQSISGSKE